MRDPLTDPHQYDRIEMYENVWQRIVIHHEKGVVIFYAIFGGVWLSPMSDTIGDWIESVKGKRVLYVAD